MFTKSKPALSTYRDAVIRLRLQLLAELAQVDADLAWVDGLLEKLEDVNASQ
jgi:hypothetical protein